MPVARPRRSHHAEAIKNYQTRDLINLGYVALALARPQASMFGQDAYPSVWGKAGALVHSLVSTTRCLTTRWWTETNG